MRKQPRVLEHIADAALVLRHERCRAAVSTSTRPSTAIAPSVGRISPAIMLTSDVLPEPDGPNSAVSRPPLSKRGVELEGAEPVADVDRQRHSTSIRLPTRRASTSEAISAAMEMTIEISVSRSAPASPPGTCVKV